MIYQELCWMLSRIRIDQGRKVVHRTLAVAEGLIGLYVDFIRVISIQDTNSVIKIHDY
jgi:hypothetical protein